jgi:DNA-binding transcriptional LysR family regulator
MPAAIDLALLSTFVAVADATSFTKAASKLRTTTGTVSRDIAKLEALLGAELVHRTTRRVSLSTAGAALYERAAPHVRALLEAANQLPEGREDPGGTLRITAPYLLGATLLGSVVARFTARYPKVRVEADLTNRNVDIVAEGFDLAIRGLDERLRDSSLAVRRVARRASLQFYASPSYLARRGTPRALGVAEHEWLVFGPAVRFLDLPKGFVGRVVANDFLFLREAAQAGSGIAMLPTYIAEPSVTTGALVPILPSARRELGGIAILYPSKGPIARKVIAFRDFLVDVLKKQSFE